MASESNGSSKWKGCARRHLTRHVRCTGALHVQGHTSKDSSSSSARQKRHWPASPRTLGAGAEGAVGACSAARLSVSGGRLDAVRRSAAVEGKAVSSRVLVDSPFQASSRALSKTAHSVGSSQSGGSESTVVDVSAVPRAARRAGSAAAGCPGSPPNPLRGLSRSSLSPSPSPSPSSSSLFAYRWFIWRVRAICSASQAARSKPGSCSSQLRHRPAACASSRAHWRCSFRRMATGESLASLATALMNASSSSSGSE